MALTAKKVYAILKRQISDMEAKLNSPVKYRGTVSTADLLPLNPDIGDMYNIESKSVYGEAGMNVAWNGVVWDTMGAPIDMSLYLTKEEAEAVIQRLVTEYFEKNPVKPGSTTEQALQIEQNKTDIASLKTETGSLKEEIADKATLENGVVKFWKASTEESRTDTLLYSVDISSIGGTGGLDLENLTLSVSQVGNYQRLSMSDGTTTKNVDIPITTITDEQVQTAVTEYLDANPVQTGATQEEAEQIQKNANDIAALNEDLNNYAKSDYRYIPTTENNKFCRWDTGIIQSYDGKSVCSRIPVTEFENVEIYSNNDIYAVCFFNGETFVSGSSTLPKSFSIPANCNNVIISFDGLDTNIVLVYRSKIDDYIVNTQVLPTYEFSVKTTKNFMRWDDGRIVFTNDYMMTQPFIVEPSKEYYVTGAITLAACFLNGSTFVSGTALNGIDHFTIPEGCNRCVVDFNIITDLPTIMVRDPLLRNTSLCYGKVLGCLGDSITQGAGNNNHSWVDKMQSMCGFKSVYNYGVSGDTIEKMHDRIDAMESTLDYITLLGGTNNALWSNSQSIADFKASFDSLVSSIIEKYPTSKVLGIIPPKYNYSSGDVTRNWNVPTSPNNLKLIDFVNAEIEIYSKYSVPIVNLFTSCNIQPDINAQKIGLMPDGVHFNQKGYFDFIAPKIAQALNSI